MFGKKKQAAPQQIIEEYSDQESEPLVEEVDRNYEPSDQEVKQYAIQVLGMSLPEDQNLLYLAREGLKAPIPQNWVPYQSRTGEIYYKHKITQEKIYQHPTDLEYRKLYSQQKQKMARKNLKSMAFKQNVMQQNSLFGQPSSLLGPSSNQLMSNLSNLSGVSGNEESQQEMSIDPNLVEEWEDEVKYLEQKEEKQWKEFEREMEDDYQRKIKKYYTEYQEELDGIKNPGSTNNKTASKLLEDQKQKIKKNFDQTYESNNKQALRLYEKQQQNKLQQYKALFQQDNSIKIKKIQAQLNQTYETKKFQIENTINQNLEKEQKLRMERMQELEKVRKQLENPNNSEIKELLTVTLENNLSSIQNQFEEKLRKREEQLMENLREMRKILGIDKTHQLQELAQKKNRLQSLSNKKIEAYKQKQINSLQSELQRELQKAKSLIERQITKQYQLKQHQYEQQLMGAKLREEKNRINAQYEEKTQKRIKDLEENLQNEKNKCEREFNEKLNGLRQHYINEEMKEQKSTFKGSEVNKITNNMLIQEKQEQIHHKQEIIKMLQKELCFEQKELSIAKLNQELSEIIQKNTDDQQKQKSLHQYFLDKFRKNHIQYQSPQYKNQLQIYRTHLSKYKEDKKILNKISKMLQEQSMMAYRSTGGAGSSALIRKYNEDVRVMRENQKMLNKFEFLLKKAQVASKDNQHINNLQEFMHTQFQYQQVNLKNELRGPGMRVDKQEDLVNIDINGQNERKRVYHESEYSYSSSMDMNKALQKHSEFLNNMKHQLNRKLYELRYDTRY